ncbi:hypothetical protein Taro_020167 [Colocasia esculenta]|uniref:Uncharacterized protein n=1 Tax=Colocasia esculenta TaxID=4460 RepID=A0A843UYV5_COLES|nr:hypothetical protein [Colocasia esculenta]
MLEASLPVDCLQHVHSNLQNHWRTVLAAVNRGARCGSVATSTAPRSKAYSTTISHLLDDSPRRRYAHAHKRLDGVLLGIVGLVDPSHKLGFMEKSVEREFIPVCVSLGLIALSVSLGLFSANLQLLYAPNVYVSKKRREMFPEVYDPNWAATEADRFLSRSIFRRLAHLQDFDRVRAGVSDPTRPGSRLHQ